MEHRRLAAALPHTPRGTQPNRCAGNPCSLLEFSARGTACRSRDSSAHQPPPPLARQRSFGPLRMLPALLHEQLLRRGDRRVFYRRRLRQYLSAGRRSDRPPISVFSSRFFQRHLLIRSARRTARARYTWLCGHLSRGRCRHRHSTHRHLPGNVASDPYMARIQNDWAVTAALALALPFSVGASTLAERIDQLLASTAASRRANW